MEARHGDVPGVRGLRPQLPQGPARPPDAILQGVQHALHVLRARRGVLPVFQQEGRRAAVCCALRKAHNKTAGRAFANFREPGMAFVVRGL